MTFNRPLYRLIALAVIFVPLSSCTELQFLNPDLFGTAPRADGSLPIVIQNLTQAASNGEVATVTVRYTTTDGGSGSVDNIQLPSVPEDERPDNDAYRDTIVLGCSNVQTVTISASITRPQIVTEELEGVFTNPQSNTIFLADKEDGIARSVPFFTGNFVDAESIPDGSILGEPTTHNICRRNTVTETIPATNAFSAFVRGVHFNCGSVLIFAITEPRNVAGQPVLNTYTCDLAYTPIDTDAIKKSTGADIALIASLLTADQLAAINDGLLNLWVDGSPLTDEQQEMIDDFEETEQSIGSTYVREPQTLMALLYPYPASYLAVAISIPQVDAGTVDIDLLTDALLEQAVQEQ